MPAVHQGGILLTSYPQGNERAKMPTTNERRWSSIGGNGYWLVKG